ncbi:MAG TPA: hypothetical protein VIF57_21480, partial [Polyangia bacterium]
GGASGAGGGGSGSGGAGGGGGDGGGSGGVGGGGGDGAGGGGGVVVTGGDAGFACGTYADADTCNADLGCLWHDVDCNHPVAACEIKGGGFHPCP